MVIAAVLTLAPASMSQVLIHRRRLGRPAPAAVSRPLQAVPKCAYQPALFVKHDDRSGTGVLIARRRQLFPCSSEVGRVDQVARGPDHPGLAVGPDLPPIDPHVRGERDGRPGRAAAPLAERGSPTTASARGARGGRLRRKARNSARGTPATLVTFAVPGDGGARRPIDRSFVPGRAPEALGRRTEVDSAWGRALPPINRAP